MISLCKFNSLSKDEQQHEIEYVAKMLELTYTAYDECEISLLRGQYWKLEKYLILYLYLQK